jgi:hypothetical protein
LLKLRGAGLQEQYQVAFDFSTQPFAFEGWMAPLIILPAIGLLFVIIPQSIVDRVFTSGPKGRAGKIFGWVFFLFTSFVSGTWLVTSMAQTANFKSALESGQASVVEGCLQHFHPMREGGHENERLELDGRLFEYSDYQVTSGFNSTESHGGPIHPDSKLRLTIVGSDIVKVEVRQHACPAAADFPNS